MYILIWNYFYFFDVKKSLFKYIYGKVSFCSVIFSQSVHSVIMTNYSKFQPFLTSSFSKIETTKKEYMYREKIIICKYHLKDKCKFWGKCNFLHIKMKEIEENLEEISKLRSENALLKTEFYKMVQENKKLKLNESADANTKSNQVISHFTYRISNISYLECLSSERLSI